MISVDYVPLQLAPGKAWAGLREICGFDEESVGDTDTLTAIHLLDRLLVDDPCANISPGGAATLTASDRDWLLAAVYLRTYSPRIESTVRCRQCGDLFDLDFSLQALIESLKNSAAAAILDKHPDAIFELPDGRRFRLPTGEDEIAIRHLPATEGEMQLLARCFVEGDPTIDPDATQVLMREVAPLLNLDLEACCPECGEVQPVHFNIQSYLLTALASEHKRLAQEVHCLAVTYGWSRQDILSLPRSQRRIYIDLIEAERQASQRG